jgi:DNA polymerase III gamma/tau subunit
VYIPLLVINPSNLLCKFSAAEVDVHKLRNALEVLSETEKQLKTTKNQSTWLTAALLQFNMREPYSLEALDDTAGSSMFTESQTGNQHSLPEKACFIAV